MPDFNIINNAYEITLDNNWTPSTKFNSKDRLVDSKGKAVGPGHKGHQYKLIDKRETMYSTPERIGRGFIGVVAVVCSASLFLFLKPVRNLFTKSKRNVRFGILEKQTEFRVDQNKIVYIKPELLFGGSKIPGDQELNFALVKTGTEEKLVAVTGTRYGKDWITYDGSPLEALLILAQDKEPNSSLLGSRHYGSPIDHFLKHPNNSLITEQEFFKFILEKNETGTQRICTLNTESTLEVLSAIKDKNISIDLNEKTPTGETLFTLWAGKGNSAITKVILELDPSVIEQTQVQIKSAFVEAVLNGFKEEADILIEAMEKKRVDLSQEELWIKTAFKNNCKFSEEEFTKLEEEFTKLDEDLKIKIFFVANAFGNEDIVKKLKPLGMDTVPLFSPGPSILARNMDIVTTRNKMEAFLTGLRKDSLLLTTEEFSKLDKHKYMDKGHSIGRIQGKNFIEKLVMEYGLKYIKVPKKIAIINKDLKSISFCITSKLELISNENQLTIYAERVERVAGKKLSLEEATEFMIILEKTGYSDFFGDNFFFCKDGIYFVDTEYKDFSPTEPQFGSIRTLEKCVDPKDVDKFLEAYEKRKEAYDKEKESREAQKKEYQASFEKPYTELTKGYAFQHQFVFPLASLE